MRRAIFGALFIALISVAAVAQESYTIASSTRLPAQSFVGDTVELRLRVRTESNLETPSELPTAEWGSLDSIRVTEVAGDRDVRIVLTPFETGALTLPPVDLGEVIISGISVHVDSILAGQVEPAPMREQLLLPGTRAAIAAAASVIVIGVLILLAILRGFIKPLAFLRAWQARRRPRRRFDAAAVALHRRVAELSCDAFYSGMVEALRGYLNRRFSLPAECLTSTEVLARLPERSTVMGLDPVPAAPVAAVLRSADRARFAGRVVAQGAREAQLRALEQWVAEIETEYRRRRRIQRRRQDVGV